MVDVAMEHVVTMIELLVSSGLKEGNSQLVVRAAADLAQLIEHRAYSCKSNDMLRKLKNAKLLRKGKWQVLVENYRLRRLSSKKDLYYQLIKAGLFAEASCAFVQLGLNGHVRPVSSADLQTQVGFNQSAYLRFPAESTDVVFVDSLERLQYASSLLGIDLLKHRNIGGVDSTARVIGNSRVDACEHGDGEDVSHSIG